MRKISYQSGIHKEPSLIVVDAGNDELSGFNKEVGWGGWREEITRFSQALFSGRPGERDFWLCLRSEEDKNTVMMLGGMKPFLHGSDAHKIDDLFRPAQDRFCWIKADPTFEGLRCQDPCDSIPKRSYPLLQAREVLRLLAEEGTEGSVKEVEQQGGGV